MSKKVFIINAPPKSGKDTLANGLSSVCKFSHVRFKTKLYEIMKAIYDINDAKIEYYSSEDVKDKEGLFIEGKNGLSFRSHLITVSEELIKPVFGKNYFGESLANEIEDTHSDLFVVSDGGFKEEVEAVVERFGKENVFCIYLSRPGIKGFEEAGDSRRRLPKELFGGTFEYVNDKEYEDLNGLAKDVYPEILKLLTGKG